MLPRCVWARVLADGEVKAQVVGLQHGPAHVGAPVGERRVRRLDASPQVVANLDV
jgi:hypothetical protein